MFGLGNMTVYDQKIVLMALACAIFTFVVDQGTKSLVLANAELIDFGIPVLPGFNLILGRNDGVSFGLLGGAPIWLLSGLALAICAWLIFLLLRTNNWIEGCAYGAIIGGALGNVLDRLRYGAVTDFLDVYIGTSHWPTFNMADVFVVGGAGFLILASLLDIKKEAA